MLIRFLPISVIFIFIFYCLIFTFLNEPLLGFANEFNENHKKNLNLNSDFIFSYSFNKDLFSGISLKGWAFPPNFHFIEIFLSMIPTLLSPNLNVYIFLISPIQILLFSLIISFFQKNNYNFFNNFSNFILSFLLFFLFLKLNDLILFYFFDKNTYIAFFLEQLFHTVGTHSLSAIIAVLMYYYYNCYQHKSNNQIIFFLLFFTFSFSDIFFAVYFLSFYGFIFLIEKKFSTLKRIIILIFLAFLTILITLIINPNLKIHILNKFNFGNQVSSTTSFFEIFIITIVLFLLPTTLFYILKKRDKMPKYFEPLFYGSILVHLFNLVTGLTKDFYSVKYSSIIVPVTILYFSIYLKGLQKKIVTCIIGAVFISTLLLFFISLKKNNNIFDVYKSEVTCIKSLKDYKNYNLASTYWPGKIIFEKLHRQLNFFQLTFGMGRYHWHNNNAWENIYNTENDFQNYLLITEGIHLDFIEKLKKVIKTEQICNDKIILIKNIDFKFSKYSLEFNQK